MGINGKNSEIHAEMGLDSLKYIQEIYNRQRRLTGQYMRKLENQIGRYQTWHPDASISYDFFPIIFSSEEETLNYQKALAEQDIYARRYFYPSLNQYLPYVDADKMPVSEDIAKRVLCLPLYYNLKFDEVDMICSTILEAHKYVRIGA